MAGGLSPEAAATSITDMITKVGFPVVMVLVMGFLLYKNNQEMQEQRLQSAKTIAVVTSQLDRIEKNQQDGLKEIMKCGQSRSETNPLNPNHLAEVPFAP